MQELRAEQSIVLVLVSSQPRLPPHYPALLLIGQESVAKTLSWRPAGPARTHSESLLASQHSVTLALHSAFSTVFLSPVSSLGEQR